MARSADSKQKHEQKMKNLAKTREIAGEAFRKLGFNEQVHQVVEFINDLKPAVGCKKQFNESKRKSFEFIRCGFQKFLLEHDAKKMKQFGVPSDEDQVK